MDTAGVSDTGIPDSAAPEQEEEPEEEKEPEEEPEEAKGDLPAGGTYTLTSAYPFSGGVARIMFRDDNNAQYIGMMDTSGKLLHYTTEEFNNLYCENGILYGSLFENHTFNVICPDGNAASYKFEEGAGITPAATGDGYVVIEEDKSGFEAVEYVFHVYDPTGKELTTYSTTYKDYGQVLYKGEGVFFFKTKGDSNWCYDIYFAKSDTWVKGERAVDLYNGAYNNYLVVDDVFLFRHISPTAAERAGEIAYTDTKGNVQTAVLPEVANSESYLGTSGGILFFQGASAPFVCYDTKSKTTSTYQGKFAESDKIWADHVTGDGYLAFALSGADGNPYTMLLNSKLEDVLEEPLSGVPAAIQDGVLYTRTRNSGTLYAYDLTGNKLGEFPSGDVRNMGDGIILTNSGKYEYLKPDGTPAFEEIDYSTGKRVTLPA